MFDAMTLYGSTIVFSPWFPRGGDFVALTAECIEMKGTQTLDIKLFHKNSADPGDGANVDTAGTKKITLSAVGRTTLDWAKSGTITGVKELVRFQFDMKGSGTDSIRFRLLPPIWYDDVVEP